jgi:hypothetical protein
LKPYVTVTFLWWQGSRFWATGGSARNRTPISLIRRKGLRRLRIFGSDVRMIFPDFLRPAGDRL